MLIQDLLRFYFEKNDFIHGKILLIARSRVSVMLRLCLNFEDFYPRYAYKRSVAIFLDLAITDQG